MICIQSWKLGFEIKGISMTDIELESIGIVILNWIAIALAMVGFYHVLKVLTGGGK